jgi:hypothetical protein
MKDRVCIICLLLCAIVIVFPLSVISLIFYIYPPDHCSYENNLGFYMSKFVLGLNIVSLISCTTLIICHTFVLYKLAKKISYMCVLSVSILNIFFGFAWLVIGSKIIYENNDCRNNGFVHIFYALTLWAVSAFHPYKKIKRAEYDDL